MAVQCHTLRILKPAVYYPQYRSGPIGYSTSLSSIGVSNGSVLYIRWRLLGGTTRTSQMEPDDRAQPESTSRLAFTTRTGRLDLFLLTFLPDFQLLDDGKYKCRLCTQTPPLLAKRVKRHEKSDAHQAAVHQYLKSASDPMVASSCGPSTPPILPTVNVRGPFAQFMDEMRGYMESNDSWQDWVNPATGTAQGVDWAAVELNADLQPSFDKRTMQNMAEKMRCHLLIPEGMSEDSDEEVNERPAELDEGSDYEDTAVHRLRARRKITDQSDLPYFPWPDRETCILDILRHIPRSAFSRKQNEIIHWAMLALGVKDLPSDRTMDDIDRALQQICGIESLRFNGALGHIYYTNDFSAILAQEMSNPMVRQELHVCPEDTGSYLAEAWQASRWKDELDSFLTTPMIRLHDQDFYIDEIALTSGGPCMPYRWFIRNQVMYAHTWCANPHRDGWIIDISQTHDIAANNFVLSGAGLSSFHSNHHLPSPRNIYG
ncbi:hypothetical protein H0H92_005084 [Tricholoma furcatifolium]|nr:hypothetical protein H0H92_005084 [Tricholoma furcatifolium]